MSNTHKAIYNGKIHDVIYFNKVYREVHLRGTSFPFIPGWDEVSFVQPLPMYNYFVLNATPVVVDEHD